MRTHVIVGHLADRGLERDHQEDAYAFSVRPPDSAAAPDKGAILVVADGVGGQQAGEVASRMAVSLVPEHYYASTGDDALASLRQAIVEAGRAIRQAAQAPGYEQMATTIVCAVIQGEALIVGHAGDSRAYLLRGGVLSQLTRDHSLVAELLDKAAIKEEDVARHPQRHVITRCLGSGAEVEPEMQRLGPLKDGDRLLLCTDGLYDAVDARQIRDALLHNHPQLACQTLVGLANRAGGSDNIAVVVAEIQMEREAITRPATPRAAPQPAAVAPMERERLLSSEGQDPAAPVLPLRERDDAPRAGLRSEAERAQLLEAKQQRLVAQEQALQEREAALAEREQALQQRQAVVEGQQASLRQQEARDEHERAELEAQREALQAEQRALAAEQEQLEEARRTSAAREAELDRREELLKHQEEAQRAQQKPALAGFAQVPRLLRPHGAQPVYHLVRDLVYEASATAGATELQETIRLPGGTAVTCGLTVRQEHVMHRYPFAIEVWAAMPGNRAGRLLVGHGMDASTISDQRLRGYSVAVIVAGDEIINLRAGPMQAQAALTRCAFAPREPDRVRRDGMLFVALTVRYRVEVHA
ncbi:MAG TPA: protein phosphatase 2C domain-containing protein [Anaerolineae bacterium]|nr:protein phosphatase 2C domain-containing protein [Anaerolineae bacterium]HOQ97681.1 protein phosphatase 2C domain-containing protein [Anaerolineae bacterium]HPL26613.1 protein phosphatase 2C domain-containing protein [Anaerolineae bacterium]